MLHDPDLVSIQAVQSKVGKACQAWQSYSSFSPARVHFAVRAAQETGFRSVGDNSYPRRHSSNLFVINDVLAIAAQDGKMYIGPSPSSRRAREISPRATMFWFWLSARPETCQ